MLVYIWARRNPFGELLVSVRVADQLVSESARMNFLGVFTFTAPYLPWVLLSFSVLHGNEGALACVASRAQQRIGKSDMLGILVGHLYYFLEDVYPRMIPSRFVTRSLLSLYTC